MALFSFHSIFYPFGFLSLLLVAGARVGFLFFHSGVFGGDAFAFTFFLFLLFFNTLFAPTLQPFLVV